MRLNRIALTASLLALGVAACGDDVEIVQPTPEPPPPPPPVEASMAPASASVAVGSSVVFAVTASGGVAGDAASWTCASSNTGIATVTVTSAGCQATGVAAGSVTITAAVSKSGETVNVGAELTVTSDEVVGGDPAFVVISSIGRLGDDGISQAESFSGRLDVGINVERGDQTVEMLSLLVDGEVVATQQLAGGPAMAPEAEGDQPAEQAPQTYTLTFNTAAYDVHDDHADVAFMNGAHELSAQLQIAGGMMSDGMMGHQTVYSNVQTVRFDNKDGVHLITSAPGEPVINPQTGDLWYGGPDQLEITFSAIPVMYSGDSVESVTVLTFCGSDAASADSAPYEFVLECDNTGSDAWTSPNDEPETPRFTMVADGESLGEDDVATKDDGIFPIRLDYAGPEAPKFRVNPGDPARQDGWINADLNLVGRYRSTARNNWLYYPSGWDDPGPGVGGYTPQLRYSSSDPDRVASARAAEPSSAPTLPPESDENDTYCFIATAIDLLGNESGLPSSRTACATRGNDDPSDDGITDESTSDEITAAAADDRSNIIRVGVDTTPPTAEFARSSLDEDSRATDDEFVVEVTDNRGGSGIHEGTHQALVASLEVRDTEGTQCIIGGEPEDNTRLCDEPYKGLTPLADDLVRTTEVEDIKFTGYYTFTAQAQDKAGNLSEEISRVALNDTDFDARASVRVRQSREDEREFSVDITVDDDLSVRDGYAIMNFTGTTGTTLYAFRLGDLIEVDPYNSPVLNTDLSLSLDTELPFLALGTAAGAPTEAVTSIDAYVRDQSDDPSGAYSTAALGNTGITITGSFQGASDDNAADIGDNIPADIGIALAVVEDVTDPFDENDDITLRATVTVPIITTGTPTADDYAATLPFKRVYFYAMSSDDNDAASHWRLIDSLGKAAYEETTTATEFTYEIEIEGGDLYAIVDDDSGENYDGGATTGTDLIAIGVLDDTDAVTADPAADPPVTASDSVRENVGVVGMVSDDNIQIRVEEP